jgi:Right handed beta helix region
MGRVLLTVSCIICLQSISSHSATYHVAKTGNNANSCAQAQSSSTPRQTIQAGVNCATSPGDVVSVHTGTYNESVSTWPASGSSGNPIRIQPNGYTNDGCATPGCGSGDAVTWAGGSSRTISINERSWIRIQGFTLANSTNRYAVWLENLNGKSAAPMLGIEILNNTFSGNGNNGATESDHAATIVAGALGYAEGASSPTVTHHWSGNTFTNNYGFSFLLVGTSDTEIKNNVSTGQRGSFNASTGYYSSGLLNEYSGGSNNDRNVIDGNTYSNPSPGPTPYEASGIRCDSSGAGHLSTSYYKNNIIHDISQGVADLSSQQESYGMFFEAGCSNIVVQNNILYNIGSACLRIGSTSTGGPTGGTVEHNTLYSCGFAGLQIFASNGVTYRNNIISTYGAQVVGASNVPNQTLNNTFRNNLYWKPSSTSIAHWDSGDPYPYYFSNLTLSQWNSKSGETGAKNQDPLFVNAPTDFTLQAASPAKNAGDDGKDIGAYPTSPPSSSPPAPTNVHIVSP